jgi:hypothetical protein
LKKSELTFIKSVFHETTANRPRFGAMQRRGAVMSVLLWYFPFTMFSGACDLALSMRETQSVGRQPADAAERVHESDDPTRDRFGLGG